MFGHNGAGGRAPDETKDNSVKRSTKVVPPHKDDIVAFQNIERISAKLFFAPKETLAQK